MKELIDNLETTEKADYLLDTCFLIYELENNNTKNLEEFCNENNVAMISFNLEELEHVSKKISNHFKDHLRKFLKSKVIKKIVVDVHPGNREAEEEYVRIIDEELLRLIPDHSDAVLIAKAFEIKASVLTRDKHHLYTSVLANYNHNIKILNNLVKN